MSGSDPLAVVPPCSRPRRWPPGPTALRAAGLLLLLSGCGWSQAWPGADRGLALSATSATAPLTGEARLRIELRNTGGVARDLRLAAVADPGLTVRELTPTRIDALAPGAAATATLVVETGTVDGELAVVLTADDATLTAWVDVLADYDGDGAESAAIGGPDCDDLDPDIGPHASEHWYDGVDQDCDGADDDDADGDGSPVDEDCDDDDPDSHPGAAEQWYDGVDQDCDGNDSDADGDGIFGTAAGGVDCDDDDPDSYPGAPDPDDGVDQDCDGIPDDDSLGPGSLVLTELQLRAAPEGPWIELWSAHSSDRPLAGLTLRADTATRVLPADAPVLAPGAHAVICGDAAAAAAAGLSCALVLEDWPWAPTGGDAIQIQADLRTLDSLRWSASWPLSDAVALQLDPAVLAGPSPDAANDSVGAWCPASTGGAPSLGTPGAANPPCP